MKLFNLVRYDINHKTTSVIGRNLSEEEVKKQFEQEEYLSKMFANGTYNIIEEVKEVEVK